MIRVAIVEDTDSDAALLERHLHRFGEENNEVFAITRFQNAISFLEPYTAGYDLVIMDIQMPHMSGMAAAYRLRELDENVLLFFVTSLTQYAIEGYEVRASNYIIKPARYADFALKLKRALKSRIDRGDSIVIKTELGQVRIAPNRIRYLESVGHNVIYHTLSGDYVQYASLTKAAEPLENRGFFRINSCYLVNLAYVRRITGYEALLDEGCSLKISQPRKKTFVQAFEAYGREKKS